MLCSNEQVPLSDITNNFGLMMMFFFSIRFIPILRRLKRKCDELPYERPILLDKIALALKSFSVLLHNFIPHSFVCVPRYSHKTTTTHNHHLAIVLKKANNKCHTLVTSFAVSHHLTS